ncbi:hypothetical protein G6F46_011486 [Rhizopus delemar]|nr:hypothetical protein G6F55_009436 [Rhizopus delemar]KAG1541366.1 hypothetical protein G6F51_007939 [Rhizopus arrhizus]KAG1489665.1 hypothetical protein G6F54_011271 [Rhizopus delemar]KAG1511214.1 hypothetical protein G6F53_006108 [Rhizopus delemar]KAG1515870.1 hypothetical protein G6F52_009576 [Rhizopus delemar]
MPSLSIQEDEEDICPVCDTDCTCGISAIAEPVVDVPKDNVVERIGVAMKKKAKKKSKKKKKHHQEKIAQNITFTVQEEDEDEEVVVDDLDDLLDTMSPLSDQESEREIIEEKELFTDDSEHIDSGDDEDIETAETQAIINEIEVDSDENSDSSDEIMYIEDEEDFDSESEDEEEYLEYNKRLNHWSTTDEEDEEDEEDEFLLFDQGGASPAIDNDNTYDNIVSAFMHALAPNDPGGADSNGANTPIAGKEEQLSASELVNALSLLSSLESSQQVDLIRRPSLPSSTVSAAQRHRGSQDLSSEALRTLSNIISDDFSLSFDSTHASSSSSSNSLHIDTSSSLHIQDQLSELLKQTAETVDNKKRLPKIEESNENDNSKKRKLSQSNSIEMPIEEVSMDDLVDTSQLHSDEEDNDQEHPYLKDLSRWQRIPISAFRLMRSKNKLWLER